MAIRKALKKDAFNIKQLVSSLSYFYLEDGGTSLPSWFANTLETSEFERRILSDNFTNYVFTENEVVVGYIAIKDNDHLYHLFVAENHQGKGISKSLWQHAISELATKVYTVRSSLYAIPVYQHFGFKVTSDALSKDGIGYQPMSLTL